MPETDRERLMRKLSTPGTADSRHDHVHTLADMADAGAPTVILFHPVGGGLLCYRKLARELSSFARVIGVEANSEMLQEYANRPLAELASKYVDILGMGSDEVAVMCGWSHGGLLAWEAASALADDEHAPAVVMVDTIWPEDPGMDLPPEDEIASWFVEDLARTNQLDPESVTSVDDLTAQLHLDDTLVAELLQVFILNSQAFLRHTPTSAPHRLTIVAALDTQTRRLPQMSSGPIEVMRVNDVDHYTLLATEAGVRAVAEAIRAASRGACA